MRTLVYFEDSAAVPFGRIGIDGCQDARSGDGSRVFQAKYHQSATPSQAIRDALDEARRIALYRTDDHDREQEWRHVTRWRLVTNASFNPTDHQKWIKRVVPVFAKLGLEADYWSRSHLDGLLTKHPEVDRSYFQNETRVFLTLPEVFELILQRSPFLRRDKLGRFVGRATEIQKIREFLAAERLFLLVQGAGGVGKTRLAVEAGVQIANDGGWQVLWANEESMAANSSWFAGIVPERPTLLIVDDPSSDQILRQIVEQLQIRVGRLAKWRVIVTLRAWKDPIVQYLNSSDIKPMVDELSVANLPQCDAEAMCAQLIDTGPLSGRPEEWRRMAARDLATRFSGHAVWLTFAVHVLENTGDLAAVPRTAIDLAEKYLQEIEAHHSEYSAAQLRVILNCVSILGILNRKDVAAVEFLANEAHFPNHRAAEKAIAWLVDRRALVARGAYNRIVEVKPDVLRDHLLRKSLVDDIGYGPHRLQPSSFADSLLQKVLDAIQIGPLERIHSAILVSVARTEFLMRRSEPAVDLLSKFLHDVIQGIDSSSASKRLKIVDVCSELAPYRPEEAIRLSEALRRSVCHTERISSKLREYAVSHEYVLAKLPQLVYRASFGAPTQETQQIILKELCELAEAEAAIAERRNQALRNDGQRAVDLIRSLLNDYPQFWTEFHDIAEAVATKLLGEVVRGDASSSRFAALKALLVPILSAERRWSRVEGAKILFQHTSILPGDPWWIVQKSLKGKIRARLESDQTPGNLRSALWTILEAAHLSMYRLYRHQESDATLIESLCKELSEDLSWIREAFAQRIGELQELATVRSIWRRHIRSEEEPGLRAVADLLEQLYQEDDIAKEFESLLNWDDSHAGQQRAVEKAKALAADGPVAIGAFLDRATRFLANDPDLVRIKAVGILLGEMAPATPAVQEFVRRELESPVASARSNFAGIAACSWMSILRVQAPDKVTELVGDLVSSCGSEMQRCNLLIQLYAQAPQPGVVVPGDEIRFIRSYVKLFIDQEKSGEFAACATWAFDFDWVGFKELFESMLAELDEEATEAAIYALIRVLMWSLKVRPPRKIPDDLHLWLFDQVSRIPDLDSFDSHTLFANSELFNMVGRVPLACLVPALLVRQNLEIVSQSGRFFAVGSEVRLSHFVTPIDASNHLATQHERVVRDLLNLVSDLGTISVYLHLLVRDIDPGGQVAPEEIALRIAEVEDRGELLRLSRLSCAYATNSIPWRTIARAALERASAVATSDERTAIYAELWRDEREVFTSIAGQVPSSFVDAVLATRQRLGDEEDGLFRIFWQWELSLAEKILREAEEMAKEERGE